jgi:hypothetical protein
MNTLTHEHLRSVLSYSKESGNFVWLISCGTVKAGRIAGSLRKDGYVQIVIDKIKYKAHRLAWFYVNGKWPRGRLDHKDNCGANNRWDNIRRATHSQNMANRKLNANSSTGFKGVYEKPNGRFRAHVQKKGKRLWLGTFGTAEEAAIAAAEKSIELHGAFARRA